MRWTQKNIQQNKTDAQGDDIDKKIEDFKYELDSINSWIVSADNKVSIYCGMYSVVIAVIAFIADHVMSAIVISPGIVNKTFYCLFIGSVIISIVGFLVSIFFYTCAIKPNLIGNKGKGNNKELSLFYKDIAELDSPREFINIVSMANRKTYLDSLASEIYYNSKVCTEKMMKFQIAVTASAVTIFFSIASCIAYYFAHVGI